MEKLKVRLNLLENEKDNVSCGTETTQEHKSSALMGLVFMQKQV